MIRVKLEDSVREYANKQVTNKNFGNRSKGFNGNKEKQYTGILGECAVYLALGKELPTYDSGSVVEDVIINDKKVDIKSMARNSDMRDNFVHNFVAYQKDSNNDVLIGVNINKKSREAQICAWLPKEEFLKKARFFEKGTKITRFDGTSFVTGAPHYELEQSEWNQINSVEDLKSI